jgi:hypothetical protein
MRQNRNRTVERTFYAVFFLALITVTADLSASVHAFDSEFGNQNQGIYNASTFGGIFVSNFTSPADLGTINQILVYLGMPDVLLATSEQVNLEGTSACWVSFDVSYVGTPNTVYWLGIVFQNAGTYYYTDVSGKALYTATNIDASSQFFAGTADQPRSLSVYALYTSAASATPDQSDFGWMRSTFFWVMVVGLAVAVTAVVAFVVYRRKKP